MKAVDKAKELVDRFLDVDDGIDYGNGCGVTLYQAKQCALICVREILKNQPYDIYTIDQCNNLTKYWREVNQEIKKL